MLLYVAPQKTRCQNVAGATRCTITSPRHRIMGRTVLSSQRYPVRDLKTLLANLPGIAYRCHNDRDWPMEFVSEGAEALSGYPAATIVQGTPHWGALIHPDDRENVWAQVQDALTHDARFEIEYRIVTRDRSTKWVWERGCAVDCDRGGLCIEGFIADITAQKDAQDALRAQHEQLTRVSRLSTLGEMTAGIAHEINQPLTAISTYAQSSLRFLDPENPKPDRLRVALEKLSGEARRAGAVVKRIRDLARDRSRDVERIDCNQLIQDVEALASSDARAHGIRLNLELAANVVPVWGDPIELQQVVLNLIRNAIDAMEAIELRDGHDIILRTSNRKEGGVSLEVMDHGEGVQPDVADDLFHPFATTKSDGLGLGLSISRSIVTAHGGQLGYLNNPSGGATFVLTLPQAPGETS